MTLVTLPKAIDVPDGLANAPLVPAYWMGPECLPVKVISERRIEREPITVYAHHRHDFSQFPLDIGTPSKEMNRALEKSRGYRSATISRRNAVPKKEFLRNETVELVPQAGVFGHNDNPIAIQTKFRGLVKNPG
jgi:hypothetical protein